jgi:pheromone shutdown-related protein TraB
MGGKLGVKPGDEMKMATSTAQELGVPFYFCDREVQITLSRAWSKCDFWSKCKLLASLMSSAFSTEKLDEDEIEKLKDSSEVDSMMADLSSYFPQLKETLIDERDRYLAAKIREVAGNPPPQVREETHATNIVAVVGAGHLKGLSAHLEAMLNETETTDVEALNTLPPKGKAGKIAAWLVPVIILALIATGLLIKGPSLSGKMLLQWLILNGGLAALGSMLALGHPLTWLVSLVGAPIGTLSPVISVGMFSGVAQAWLRKPRVEDAERLAEDITSVRGVYRNRVTRALLVFFLASLGGAIGNLISIPKLALFFAS